MSNELRQWAIETALAHVSAERAVAFAGELLGFVEASAALKEFEEPEEHDLWSAERVALLKNMRKAGGKSSTVRIALNRLPGPTLKGHQVRSKTIELGLPTNSTAAQRANAVLLAAEHKARANGSGQRA